MSDRDEAMRQAERKGARAALTRLAERRRRAGDAFNAAYYEDLRDREYPAPRVRAVVKGLNCREWQLHGWRWQVYRSDTGQRDESDEPYSPTRDSIAAMYALQQRADAAGFVEDAGGLADSERSPGRQSDPSSGDAPSRPGTAPSGDSRYPASGAGPSEGTGASTGQSRGEAPSNATATGQSGASDAAPSPPTREWRVTVPDYTQEARVEWGYGPGAHHTWVGLNADVREVRPLAAAQVEALAQVLADAWARALGAGPLPISDSAARRKGYLAEARAALAYLNIPTEG